MNVNLQRCAQGHFYDADKYAACPHCQSGGAPVGKTVPLQQIGGVNIDIPPTTPHSAANTTPKPSIVPNIVTDEGKTIPYDDERFSEKPVVGWLVCTKGKHLGKSFTLYFGKNFIGRSNGMSICLSDESVSRERHAIVVYDLNSNMFLAQPGESSELFYLNGEVVLAAVPLKKNDKLQIGKAELMLIPCCDDAFDWMSFQK